MRKINIVFLLFAFSLLGILNMSAQSVLELTRAAEEAKDPFNKYDNVGYAENGVVIVSKDYKYGLVTEEDAKPVTDGLCYDYLGRVADGVYKARKGELYGLISYTGEQVLPFVYEDMGGFCNNGRARAIYHGKYGYITTDGREVIPCVYDDIESFKNGKAKVERNGKYGMIDYDGNVLVKCLYSEIGDINENGYAWAGIGGKYGIINTNNEGEVIQPIEITKAYVTTTGGGTQNIDFEAKPDFSEHDVVYVKNETNKWGLLDKNGRRLVDFNYDYISPFVRGRAWVVNNRKYGVITDEGLVMQMCRFDMVRYLNDETEMSYSPSSAQQSERKYKKDFVMEYFPSETTKQSPMWLRKYKRAYVVENKKVGIMNPDGSMLVEPMYDYIGDFSEGMAVVKLGDLYGYIDDEGKVAITCMYAQAEPFSEDIAAVKLVDKPDRFYFIDKSNQEIFHIKADSVGAFRFGKCKVWKKNKTYEIDTKGKKVKEKKPKDDSDDIYHW